MSEYYVQQSGSLVRLTGLFLVDSVFKNAEVLTVEEAAMLSAYPKAGNEPEEREGYRARLTGHVLENGVWVSEYVYDPIPFDEMAFLYDEALEAHLDEEKAARGYTKREPSDYANSTVERYAQDAVDWIAHRDAVMLYGLDIENKAKAGETIPTLAEFRDGLPKITWTYG